MTRGGETVSTWARAPLVSVIRCDAAVLADPRWQFKGRELKSRQGNSLSRRAPGRCQSGQAVIEAHGGA